VRVEAASAALFGTGELRALDEATLIAALAELPRAALRDGEPRSVVDLLLASGLATSRGDARRLIGDGGAYLNNRKVTDPAAEPSPDDLLHGRWLVLRRGKQTLAVIEMPR
jgi:tyrosyl-tRNA synthetase